MRSGGVSLLALRPLSTATLCKLLGRVCHCGPAQMHVLPRFKCTHPDTTSCMHAKASTAHKLNGGGVSSPSIGIEAMSNILPPGSMLSHCTCVPSPPSCRCTHMRLRTGRSLARQEMTLPHATSCLASMHTLGLCRLTSPARPALAMILMQLLCRAFACNRKSGVLVQPSSPLLAPHCLLCGKHQHNIAMWSHDTMSIYCSHHQQNAAIDEQEVTGS